MPSSRHHWYCPPLRKLLAVVALFAYLTATSGFAFSVLPRKGRGQPFPCQDHACGCQSAEECWRHCCCFSPEERWAWAEQHGVEPPAYAERPVSEGWRTSPRGEHVYHPAVEDHGCDAWCHAEDAQPAQPSCCKGNSCHSHTGAAATTGRPALSTLRCRGLTTLWVSLGTVPLVPAVAWSPQFPTAERLYHRDPLALNRSLPPPEPPPRSFFA